MVIYKAIWKEILAVLKKHKISYTTHLETRDIPKPMEYPDERVYDKHIQINLVIPDYFKDL